jgi:flagellar operon protein
MAGEDQLLRMLEPAVRPAGAPAPTAPPRRPVDQQSFDELLRTAADAADTQPLKVSGHAARRLSQMGVELNESQVQALTEATDKAARKGATESLMLIERLGLIVNIPNRTVITALSAQRMSEGVVTNIDSTVWVESANPAAAEPAADRTVRTEH